MSFISYNIPDTFTTVFTSNKIFELINEILLGFVRPENLTITEESYDALYDKFDPNNETAKIWNIEFNKPVNLPAFVIKLMERYIIRFTYLFGKNGESNIVKIEDISTVITCVCEDKIFSLKYFITKKERELNLRYLEREPLLLFTKSYKINYDSFSNEDLKKIYAEKIKSKKRQVLENPWLQREICEYIDYIRPDLNPDCCFRGGGLSGFTLRK